MFDRKKYKQFARIQLKGRRLIPTLITFISILIITLSSLPAIRVTRNMYNDVENFLLTNQYETAIKIISEYDISAIEIIFIIVAFAITSIISVANINTYLKMSESPEKISISTFFEGFSYWLRAIICGFFLYVLVYIGLILFIIPGIIIFLSYSQSYYIITEFKNISVTKAFSISKKITRNHKIDLIILYFSFIWHIFLGMITFGITYLWSMPYMNMTLVNTYHALMKMALESGVIKREDIYQ